MVGTNCAKKFVTLFGGAEYNWRTMIIHTLRKGSSPRLSGKILTY